MVEGSQGAREPETLPTDCDSGLTSANRTEKASHPKLPEGKGPLGAITCWRHLLSPRNGLDVKDGRNTCNLVFCLVTPISAVARTPVG